MNIDNPRQYNVLRCDRRSSPPCVSALSPPSARLLRTGCWIVGDDGGRGRASSLIRVVIAAEQASISALLSVETYRRRWGTKPVSRGEREHRGRLARRSPRQGLLRLQHHRAPDSSPSPAMVRRPEGLGLDPAWGLTGSHDIAHCPVKHNQPMSRYNFPVYHSRSNTEKFGV